jgi:hypothetical protein
MLGATPLGPEHIDFTRRRRQQRIAAQRGVIIEILITQRETIKALGESLSHRVLDQIGPASIDKAARQSAAQTQRGIDLAQEQRAAIAAEGAAGKLGHDFSRTEVLKEHRLGETLCVTGVGGWVGSKLLHTNYNRSAAAPVASFV